MRSNISERYSTPPEIVRRNGLMLVLTIVVTFALLRLALDEWVYLIATDGGNASYLLPVSVWGGVVVVGLACAYALGLVAGRALQTRKAEARSREAA